MFPKPQKKKKQKRNREHDSEYLTWIHGWSCIVPHCGKWPVDAHHVDRRSQLGSDRSCIPICHNHHIGGIHTKGNKTCEKEWGIELKLKVHEFNKLYDDGVRGPFDQLLNRKKNYTPT